MKKLHDLTRAKGVIKNSGMRVRKIRTRPLLKEQVQGHTSRVTNMRAKAKGAMTTNTTPDRACQRDLVLPIPVVCHCREKMERSRFAQQPLHPMLIWL